MRYEWTVYGDIPNPKNTMRISRAGHFYHKDDEVRKYKSSFALQTPKEYKQCLTCNVYVNLTIYRKDNRKDMHNCIIAVLDAIQDSGVIKNDRQVVELHCCGDRIDKQNPRVEIELHTKEVN